MKPIKNILTIFLLLLVCTTAGCSNEQKNNEICNNTVEIKLVESDNYSNLPELIERIKPSVVDIYLYNSYSTSAGSGVIIGKSSNSYYVVTNHHIIENNNSYDIITYNSSGETTTYQGSLIGTSPKNDIAVIEIKTDNTLTIAKFIDDSDKVRIGTEVVAIGNPLGILGGSVTHGIISATEREIYIDDIGYMNVFQTDASITYGNSGGALFNYEGLLIGIVNSGYTEYSGLNFAIPSNIVLECINSIIETKTANSLGYFKGETKLGIELAETIIYSDSNLSSQVNIIYISNILENSDGDVNNVKDYQSFIQGKYNTFYALNKINNKNIESLNEGIKLLNNAQSGEEIILEFIEISYTRTSGFFAQNAIYLTNNIVTIKIIPTQYVYQPSY